jgi:hypothetical protein
MRIPNPLANFSKLPDEIHLQVLENLCPTDAHNLAMTCRNSKRILANENSYWTRCGVTPPAALPGETTKSQVWMLFYNDLDESQKTQVQQLNRPVNFQTEKFLSALPAGLSVPAQLNVGAIRGLARLPAGFTVGGGLNLLAAGNDV